MKVSLPRVLFNLRHVLMWGVIFFALYHQALSFKYADYPWWHPLSNDMDGTHAATTVGLLNGSEYTLVYHPAATLFHVHGLVYRAAGVNPAYQDLLKLSSVKDINQAIEILSQATRLSRILVFVTMLTFVLILYGVIYQLTLKSWLAGLLSFYVVSSGALARHMVAIRAEIWALIFFLLAVLAAIYFLKKRALSVAAWIISFVVMGCLLCFSIFAKIQIAPAVVFFLVGLGIYVFRSSSGLQLKQKHLFFLIVGSIVIFPWWTLFRPEFLSVDYFAQLSQYSDLWKVYGAAPDNFVAWPIFFYILLGFWIYFRPKDAGVQLAIIGLVMGFSLAVYLILLPVSGSWERYIGNTQHLVYAVLTNMTHGGYLTHRVLDHTTFEKILQMYATDSALGRVQIIWLVGAVSLACAIRLGMRSTVPKPMYALVLSFFALAVVMDVMASMRFYELFFYYGLFSITFYAMGIGLWISLEWRDVRTVGFVDLKNILWIASVLFVVVISAYSVKRWEALVRLPQGEVKITITPEREYRDVRAHAKPFWDIVHKSIERNTIDP